MVLFAIFCPIVAAVLIMLGAPARKTALAASVLTFAVALFLFASLDHGNADFQHVTSFSISPEWRLSFTTGVDGLSVIMVLLASIVTLAAVWFAGSIERYENAFYACLLFISGGAIGAFASIDLFFFYAFHELALIPTFLLIGIWGSGNRVAAAWKITIYLAIGSFILLLGLILLYQSFPLPSRSFDIRVLRTAAGMGQIAPDAQRHVYLLLLIGFGILISLFPFHTWAPEAYAAAPAPAAMLHAGVLKKFGLYGLLRLAIPMLPEGARHWATLLIVLLLGNIIYVGLVTIAQKRLDWMLGYSSVMHMGYIFLGIASFGVLGATGAVVLMFAHGLSIALLFGIAGELRRRTGTLAFDELGGIARVMPFAGLVFGLGVFAAIGLPGFANFAGEIMIFFGAFRNGWEIGQFHIFQIATVLALWGVVLSTVYMLRAYRKTFLGSIREQWQKLPDLSPALRVPVTLLVAALLCFGFFPQFFVRNVAPTFGTLSSPKSDMQTCSHGAMSPCNSRSSIAQAPRRSEAAKELAAYDSITAPLLEIAVLVLGMVILMIEAFVGKIDKRVLAFAAITGLAIVLLATFFVAPSPAPSQATGFWSFYTEDRMAIFFKQFALLTTILVLIMMIDYAPVVRSFFPGAAPHTGLGEFVALPLFTCAGLMYLVSAIDFVFIFVALELVTVSFYVLVSFTRRNPTTLEAGTKYLVLSALSTAFLVYGIAWIFGATGQTNLYRLTAALANAGADSGAALLGMVFVLVALGFKIAAVPFQIWVPDVYQGAPTPVTAYLSVGSKAAGFVVLIRVLQPFMNLPQTERLIFVIALLTLIYGNLAALPQTNLKRLLAYSSIAHAGYLLIGVVCFDVGAITFYLVAYLLMTLLSFAVLVIVAQQTGEEISDFDGLAKRSPFLAFAMLIGMVSLAGVPFTAGFLGKFYIFYAALLQRQIALVVVGVITVGCGFYYYLKVVRAMYWQSDSKTDAIPVSGLSRVAISALIVATICLGVYPQPILDALKH